MKKTKYIFIFLALFCLLLLSNCRKDTGKIICSAPIDSIIEPIIEPNFPCEDTALGWKKWDTDPNLTEIIAYAGKRSVWRVIYDKQDKNTIYYLTDEEGGHSHYLWKYNRISKIKNLLDKDVLNNMDINKNGWLVYDKMDWNIYKIKTNGDSLTRLTNNGSCKFPKFASDKDFIYYIDDGSTTGGVFKMDLNGNRIDTLKNNVTSKVYEIKNQIYFVRLVNNIFYLVQRDLKTSIEKIILTREIDNDRGESFYDWYTNADNTILYWYGVHGLSKTDLATLQTTRLVNGGGNSTTPILHFNQNPFTKRFIAIQFTVNYIDYYHIEDTHKILEFTEDGACRQTVELPE